MAEVEKITSSDLEGKGITPLPDIPGLDSTTMKYKFEEIVRDVAIVKINEIIDALYNDDLPLATELKAGAVKAALAESSDIQPVRIGEDGMLYTAQGSGGEYHVDDELSDTSRFPVQNKVINAALAQLKQLHDANGTGLHNSIYRGRYLGDTYTAAQSAAISNGTFDDLWIGDYWTIGGVNYRIAAFDYYLYCGDIKLTIHHAVIVPDTVLYSYVMNDSVTTTGGYVGSKMYTQGLTQAKTTIKAAFNNRIVNHRVYLINAVSNGRASAGAWCDSEVDIMNEQMVYGGGIFSPVSDGTNVPANYRIEKSQLPLFQFRVDLISNETSYWLRDVVTATDFADINDRGGVDFYGASTSRGVRPAFCIY